MLNAQRFRYLHWRCHLFRSVCAFCSYLFSSNLPFCVKISLVTVDQCFMFVSEPFRNNLKNIKIKVYTPLSQNPYRYHRFPVTTLTSKCVFFVPWIRFRSYCRFYCSVASTNSISFAPHVEHSFMMASDLYLHFSLFLLSLSLGDHIKQVFFPSNRGMFANLLSEQIQEILVFVCTFLVGICQCLVLRTIYFRHSFFNSLYS